MGRRRKAEKSNLHEEKEINQETMNQKAINQEVLEEAEAEEIDTVSEGESFELMENTESTRPDKRQFLFAALVFVWLVMIYFFAGRILNNGSENAGTISYQESEESAEDSEADSVSGTVLVTGADDFQDADALLTGMDTADAEDGETVEAQAGADSSNEESLVSDDEDETENWQATIFGTSENMVLSSIKVSGLTDEQKEKFGFRESDFLKALSAFLSDNDLDGVTQVIFENEISCSSEDAIAYSLSLDNYENLLTVIMYPDYPGQYILMLQEDMETEAESENQGGSQAASSSQAHSDSQIITESQEQTETESTVQAQESTETQSSQSTSEAEQSYDATTLSVTGIPATLLNYLSNRYELQYTLYDYLYQNGYRDITAAAVTSYEIDADTRTATIYFTLSDGSSLTGMYSLDDNSYLYR